MTATTGAGQAKAKSEELHPGLSHAQQRLNTYLGHLHCISQAMVAGWMGSKAIRTLISTPTGVHVGLHSLHLNTSPTQFSLGICAIELFNLSVFSAY